MGRRTHRPNRPWAPRVAPPVAVPSVSERGTPRKAVGLHAPPTVSKVGMGPRAPDVHPGASGIWRLPGSTRGPPRMGRWEIRRPSTAATRSGIKQKMMNKNTKLTPLLAVFTAIDNDLQEDPNVIVIEDDLQERQPPSSVHRIIDPNVIVIEDNLQARQPPSSVYRIIDPNVIVIEDDLQEQQSSLPVYPAQQYPALQAPRAMPRIINIETLTDIRYTFQNGILRIHVQSSPPLPLSNENRHVVSSSEDEDETIAKTAANITATALNTSISGDKIPIVLVPRMQCEQPSRLPSERELQSPSLSSSPSPSPCPLMDNVPFLEPDFPTHFNMALLDPTPLSINDPWPFELENDDIHSLMMATTSLEPFNCRMYAMFYTRPQRVFRCKNTKLTAYLEKRHDLFGPLRPSLSACPDKAKCDRIWYEFQVGTIDKRELYVLFQLRPPTDRIEKRQSGREEDGLLRLSCQAFIKRILFAAIRDISKNTFTARGGAPYLRYDVTRAYRVMAIDYRDVARRVSEILASKNLLEICHMTYVCFYICEHGMRLEKPMAAVLADTVDVTHEHFDVL